MTRLKAALAYAKLGWRILPIWWVEDGHCACPKRTRLDDPKGDCKPGKHPFGRFAPHGVKDATTDRSLIMRWFDREPRINIAAATGPESGLLVLDIDGAEGERSLVALERQRGCLPDLYPQQWTGGGRGGWQAFFAYPAGRQIGLSAGKLGPKLEYPGRRRLRPGAAQRDPGALSLGDRPRALVPAARARAGLAR
jgi:hypothetical protein